MQKVDLSFLLLGEYLPADHGYHLYSAVSPLLPAAHQADGYPMPILIEQSPRTAIQ